MARLLASVVLAVTCLIVTVYVQQADSCDCNSCNYNYPYFYPYFYPYYQQSSQSSPQQTTQPSGQSCQGSTGSSTGTSQGSSPCGIVFNIMAAPCQQQANQPDAKASVAGAPPVTADTTVDDTAQKAT
ncbi:hypothetical protein JYU34_014181 [Plutella xylostella]|uniref:Uncharacterized protein n=1 Tax=Plutella xylostella TaxID=51655 RepID=A0ABQ7QBD3_PLUXY|nr:hypothetical protein JYU34_014181 [Plutella xylostella]